jgi:hypothetical protein
METMAEKAVKKHRIVISSDLEIGKYYKITDETHPLYGKTVKLVDRALGSFFTTQLYNGTQVTVRAKQLGPLDSVIIENFPGPELQEAANKAAEAVSKSIQAQAADLLDMNTSSSKEDRDNLTAALHNRLNGYRKDAARQITKINASERVSAILDKQAKQREELEAWRDGTWWDKYYQVCPKKVGITATAQVFNLVQLITLLMVGGAWPVLGVGLFAALLFANYKVLSTWHDNE